MATNLLDPPPAPLPAPPPAPPPTASPHPTTHSEDAGYTVYIQVNLFMPPSAGNILVQRGQAGGREQGGRAGGVI